MNLNIRSALIIFILGYFVVGVLFIQIQSSKTKQILKEFDNDNMLTVENIIHRRIGDRLKRNRRILSEIDEFSTHVQNKNFILNDQNLKNFGLPVFYVQDGMGNILYSNISNNLISKDIVRSLFKTNYFLIQTNNHLYALSTIQTQINSQYYNIITGEIWDLDFFDSLMDTTSIEIYLTNQPFQQSKRRNNFSTNYLNLILTDFYQRSNYITVLIPTPKTYSLFSEISSINRIRILFYILLSLLLILMLFLEFWIPIQSLKQALSQKSSKPVEEYLNKNNEFGFLAKSVIQLIENKDLELSKAVDIFSESRSIILMVDKFKETILGQSNGARKFYGYQDSEIKNKPFSAIHPMPLKDTLQTIDKAEINDLQTDFTEFTKDKKEKHVHLSYSTVPTADKKLILFLINDASLNHQMKISLFESNERFIQFLNTTPDTVIIFNKQLNITFSNPSAQKTFGYSSSEIIGKSFEFILPYEFRSLAEKKLNETSNNPEKQQLYEIHSYTKNGEQITLEISLSSWEMNGESFITLIGRNTSERTKIESALKQSEERFRKLTEATSASIIIFNENRILFFNTPLTTLSGYYPDEIIRKSIYDLFDENHLKEIEYAIRQAQENIPSSIETKLIKKNGNHAWVQIRFGQINFEKRNVLIATVNDITKRYEFQENLEKYSFIVNTIQNAAALINKEYKTELINPAFCELLQMKHHEIIHKNISEIMNQKIDFDHLNYKDYIFLTEKAFKGETVSHNYRILKKNQDNQKTTAHILQMFFYPYYQSQTVSHVVLIIHDITNFQQSEQELQKLNLNLEDKISQTVSELEEKNKMMLIQSRQAAMGEMIGNIAHQWRQPLSALGLILQNLNMRFSTGKLTQEFMEKKTQRAVSLIEHMSNTIEDFRNFFKPDKENKIFSVSEYIQKNIKFVEDSYKNQNIELLTHIDSECLTEGYPNEFSQVILNILTNAKDQFVKKNIKDAFVLLEIDRENQECRIKITDNAGGIPEENIDKIFDPYFTTKENGTGIGLYMCKSIIEQHMNGKIEVRNTYDGALFTIHLPIPKSE